VNELYDEDRRALEAFIFDPDLERLETLIAEFNIFEAVGAVRQELRHSDFLSFLLSPNQNHGLGDAFLKRFLMRVLMDAPGAQISAVDIDLMDMDQAEVRREWRGIDILVHDPVNALVVVIENKIDSGEHGGQLARYLGTVQQQFPTARIVPIFLTPEGDEPSEETYLALSYGTVAEVIEALVDAQSSTLGPDVQTMMAHYTTMLRRHIVSESETAELAQRIYRRHQRALDLIFEHRPDLQLEISDYLIGLIDSTDGLVRDYCSKTYIRFSPEEWDSIPALQLSEGWTRSGRILLFEFRSPENRLTLTLGIGPGPGQIRQALFDFAHDHADVFVGALPKLYAKWTTIYNILIVKRTDSEGVSLEDLMPTIDQAWERFMTNAFPSIRDLILEAPLPDVE
jgi:hypothetical protein